MNFAYNNQISNQNWPKQLHSSINTTKLRLSEIFLEGIWLQKVVVLLRFVIVAPQQEERFGKYNSNRRAPERGQIHPFQSLD